MHNRIAVSANVTASHVSFVAANGSTANFTFTVTGYPLPTVEWFKAEIGGESGDFKVNFSSSIQLKTGKILLMAKVFLTQG